MQQAQSVYGLRKSPLATLFFAGNNAKWPVHISKRIGGPTLDWSIIQPLFLGVACDVAIFLDCCFAGQAVRSRLSHNVEFLAATDKDQFTPTGKVPGRPSFTKVLMQELAFARKGAGSITISELHRSMLGKEKGLVKQPFYVELARSYSAAGIRLARWEPADNTSKLPEASQKQFASLYLRISLFHPIDLEKGASLLRWMTRDSPADIEHIEVVRQTLSDARVIEQLGSQFVHENKFQVQGDSTRQSVGLREEALALIEALSRSLSLPEATQFEDIKVAQVVENIGQASEDLLTFLKDNLTVLSEFGLEALQAESAPNFEDLRRRVAMRLVLIKNEVPMEATKVFFEHPAPMDQRLRVGRKAKLPVLVEFWNYESSDRDIQTLSAQAARVSALLSEKKNDTFRLLPGLGYIHETLRHRFGFIHELPEGSVQDDVCTVAELLQTLKVVPLEVRVKMACVICAALLNLHSIGWYHKAIKSENIVTLRKINTAEEGVAHLQHDMTNPYVVGFDCSRPWETETWASVDFSPKANLYRHPERWGTPKRFEAHHDLYALVGSTWIFS
jgi:hypothetical protein